MNLELLSSLIYVVSKLYPKTLIAYKDYGRSSPDRTKEILERSRALEMLSSLQANISKVVKKPSLMILFNKNV